MCLPFGFRHIWRQVMSETNGRYQFAEPDPGCSMILPKDTPVRSQAILDARAIWAGPIEVIDERHIVTPAEMRAVVRVMQRARRNAPAE